MCAVASTCERPTHRRAVAGECSVERSELLLSKNQSERPAKRSRAAGAPSSDPFGLDHPMRSCELKVGAEPHACIDRHVYIWRNSDAFHHAAAPRIPARRRQSNEEPITNREVRPP